MSPYAQYAVIVLTLALFPAAVSPHSGASGFLWNWIRAVLVIAAMIMVGLLFGRVFNRAFFLDDC